MFTTFCILFYFYCFYKLWKYFSKTEYVTTWEQLPKGDGKIRISHTITPDNPPSEEEWLNQHVKPYTRIFTK